jgi:hypothetical protein
MNLTIERYVWSVGRRVRPERRRAVRRELRAHLREASEDVGVREAIRRAGDPADVASDYAELDSGPRPWRPRAGALAAVVVYLLLVVLQQRELRLERAPEWGSFDPWSADLWLFHLHGDMERTLVFHIWVQDIAYVLLPLLAFLVFSRAWRRVRPTLERPEPVA